MFLCFFPIICSYQEILVLVRKEFPEEKNRNSPKHNLEEFEKRFYIRNFSAQIML